MDIRALVGDLGDYKESGDELSVCCPFCSDTKYHLSINTVKPVAHCFKCGWGGNHLKLLVESNIAESYPEAQRLLKRPSVEVSLFDNVLSSMINSQRGTADRSGIPAGMPIWFVPFVGSLRHIDSQHVRMVLSYAVKRLTPLEIKRYQIGYSTSPEYMLRLILPVERGYWQGRSVIGGGGRKYVNPDIPVGDRMFNSAALHKYKTVFIAEGIFSAIALGDNAVAVLGKEVNKAQLARLTNSGVREFIVAFDADTVGSDQVCKLCYQLTQAGKEVLVRKYNTIGGDPDNSDDYQDVEFGLEYEVVCGLV